MSVAQVPIWNVPYQRNPLFTGREDVLKRLYDALRAGKTAALAQPQAISGPGGIGKTQTAVEYAYSYRDEYNAILWVKAETEGSINSDFVTIATLLDLPEKQEQDQHRIVEAVKRWFHEHTGWLIIFDNADDIAMVRDFLPSGGKGHILLTTRAHATIIDADAPLEAASRTDQDTAREIVKAMDGLPLALEQAVAYIEETECGLQGYLRLFQAQGVQLLKEHGEFVPDHPEPVATTWSLFFEKVEQAYPAAAELLRFCAFLAPDAIPEELFTESAADLGPALELVASDLNMLNAAIRELLKYSLVHRDPETQALSEHRLVQEVLKVQMDEETQRLWAERTVRTVSSVFPVPEYTNWDICSIYLIHAQVCSDLIDRWEMRFTEVASLLNKMGDYLRLRGEYGQAEQLYQRALAIREHVLGPDHPDTAVSLNNLAVLYVNQGKYEQAEPLYQRSLAIKNRLLPSNHPSIVTGLENYASLLRKMNRIEEATTLEKQAREIRAKRST